jgi:hypothetical protein
MGPLENRKRERFCQLYLRGVHKTDAYQEAFPDASREAARTQANRLLKDPRVLARLDELREMELEVADISASMVLQQDYRLATADITKIVHLDEHGKVSYTPFDKLSPALRAAIQKVVVTTRRTRSGPESELRIELHDKNKPIERLSKVTGLEAGSLVPIEGQVVGGGGGQVDEQELRRQISFEYLNMCIDRGNYPSSDTPHTRKPIEEMSVEEAFSWLQEDAERFRSEARENEKPKEIEPPETDRGLG